MQVTKEEWRIIRKALMLLQTAHSVIETAEGIPDRETPVDGLIRKARAHEEGLTEQTESDNVIGEM